MAEAVKYTAEAFSGRSGSFSLGENAIAYSYESAERAGQHLPFAWPLQQSLPSRTPPPMRSRTGLQKVSPSAASSRRLTRDARARPPARRVAAQVENTSFIRPPHPFPTLTLPLQL